MHSHFRTFSAAVLLILSACTSSHVEDLNDPAEPVIDNSTAQTNYQIDNQSYSNCDEVHSTHLSMDLTVNFEEKKLTGFVKHNIENIT